MRYLLLLLLVGCDFNADPKPATRDNRAIQFITLVNQKAECYAVYTAKHGSIDTAYCTLGSQVVWCEASELMPPKCQKIADRQAETPEPTKVAPPVTK